MAKLRKKEREELIKLLETGESIPSRWRSKIFPDAPYTAEIGKEYRLEYAGKMKREQVLAETPAAPWQLVRNFAEDNPHQDNWRNLLVWGDNLLALRELLADQQGPNRFGTRGKIKLIYIDPPFATKQDFMKDKEKAYRDKVIGAQFIEFLRRRLIILHELLADDGSIYVHLDIKKGHYIKAILDEVFGEENFRNEIIWKRSAAHSDSSAFANLHDSILLYSKNSTFVFNTQHSNYDDKYANQRYKHRDPDGRRYMDDNLTAMGLKGGGYDYEWKGIRKIWRCPLKTMRQYEKEKKLYYTRNGVARIKRYLDKMPGLVMQDIWSDIYPVNSQAAERVNYPTQKPEALLERIVRSSSNEDDIVLDCFAGSGTVATVAEKLNRRWITIDCGKLSVYTVQQRLFTLSTKIGAAKKDARLESERIEEWSAHLKKVPGVLLITEKARKGECEVTLDLLNDIANLIKVHKLLKKDASFSLACPEQKMLIQEDKLNDIEDGPGEKYIVVKGVEFRISIITPKSTPEKGKHFQPKEFALYRAGLYDMQTLRDMSWDEYRPFVLKMFGVREDPHTRYGLQLDGYLGTNSALVWNYPDHVNLTLDYGYVADLHQTLRGKKGERFYVIAPVVAMDFAEDEIEHKGATYVFLKVPLSILMRLLEKNEAGALKQPTRESDVNEVIDAIGFDFISQPSVKYKAGRKKRSGELFTDLVVELSEFRTQTLATDPEDFDNFETFSMAMVDLDYDDDVFRLSRVFWGEDLIKEAGGVDKAKKLNIRIPEDEFEGKKMMLILCDRYGNEKSLLLKKGDF